MLKSESTSEPGDVPPGGGSHTACLQEYRIPGYLVNPENLVRVLQERFQDNYKVKLRNDNYLISIPERLSKNELTMCY
ncbi:hypothetical protein M426DRAFT_323084 [Hypoxylon sp. CI-4A]|nr:hypothetical protein M426DRAFT_323084 [Hypoxylon sp. CI-4A]